MLVTLPSEPIECPNLVGGERVVSASGRERAVVSPYDGRRIGRVRLSNAEDVQRAVAAAERAFPAWAATPLRERARVLARLRELIVEHADELANTVAMESGKTPDEARAGLFRGVEVMEFAMSLPNADAGGALEVSRGVTCEYRREPLGVVAGITPFNFPAMVPMWMFPIALTVGNAFVLKPSEKVPLTACRLAELSARAGYPPGVFSVVHGDREAVEALADHPAVKAVGFVGSSAAARAVYTRATANGKRALCLGGAKNAIIMAPDADERLTVQSVVDSFTGCAGQRCMAASLLIAVDDRRGLVEKIAEAAARVVPGVTMGALIDRDARERLFRAIAAAESAGAKLLVDGRRAPAPPGGEAGAWLGATVIDGATAEMECARAELFGPVLTVLRVRTLDEALAVDRSSVYGNATSVFTTSGAAARYVSERAPSGMVGVNVGVPVPRDPFSFGGTRESKFGHGDITGPGGVEFWSSLKKITTKWALQTDATWMS
ncbi:MAG TPA: CoA-acylating methylmalonate-semialdehyde dehydrogenase [Polyangiaceae bacterium]|nr:CoA-acylating methylmalonate-semialdehyde dehydrogenase [Polyangiaceae bacterium]